MIYDNITKATFLRRPYRKMHPEFGEAFDLAKEAGVEIWFLPCHVEPDRLEIVV
ncbi:MAG: DNA/RNA nuclease SfsA [Lachnospiraceae bacterium]|nr:DNA/RNA nuclease SfsA [Lachnospiraceae bacterium]MBR6365939.1 DNA/RNA nuclease SfsA [Lachnospiraceae bacterium]